jgi:hypothetical protein
MIFQLFNFSIFGEYMKVIPYTQDVYYTLCSLCASKYLQDIKVYYLWLDGYNVV